ncbi:MAG: hypothetical protein IE885_07075 [Campylobacterales bacterium]|nr:hypothetical protein [Campylobacterales bacterium]
MRLLVLFIAVLFWAYAASDMPTSTPPAKSDKKIYYGTVLETKEAMGYTYLKVDENGTQRWVAIIKAPVFKGDKVGYDKTTVMRDFESKSLHQTFKEIIFANEVYLPQKTAKPQSMKSMLNPANLTDRPMQNSDVKNTKPFVKKERYTIEEIHAYRNELKDQNVTLEGTVYKVSKQIMQRDWVHIGDGTGDEQALTDDLVATLPMTDVKAGDKITLKGKVTVDKDFGYGYFYKVIIEDGTIEER